MGFQTLAELNTGDVLPETWVDQVKENFEVLRGSAVTSLPVGSDNQIVRFYPSGAGSPPVWMCVFDPDLNGGAGAWAYVGGAGLTSVQSSDGDQSGTAAMIGSPTIAVPCDGIYRIGASGRLSLVGTALSEINIRATHGGTTVAVMAIAAERDQFSGTTPRHETGDVYLTAGGTVSLSIATSNSQNWRIGTGQRWQLTLTPVELRP